MNSGGPITISTQPHLLQIATLHISHAYVLQICGSPHLYSTSQAMVSPLVLWPHGLHVYIIPNISTSHYSYNIEHVPSTLLRHMRVCVCVHMCTLLWSSLSSEVTLVSSLLYRSGMQTQKLSFFISHPTHKSYPVLCARLSGSSSGQPAA